MTIKVRTIETWNNVKTTSVYEFTSLLQMLLFVKQCKEDGINFEIVKDKNKKYQRGA